MIIIRLVNNDFEHDAFALVKAFYKDVEVKVVKEELELDAPYQLLIHIEQSEAQMEVALYENNLRKPFLKEIVEMLYEDRKETKNRFKRTLYRQLSSYSKKSLPWGTLTGIRPTKIPMALMEEGYTEDEIAKHLEEHYYTSEEKIKLCIEIAKREKEILSKIDYQNGYSLYIGIPFCPSTCLYCSFTSYPIGKWEKEIDAYLEALGKELTFVAKAYEGKSLNTIYIGGGTPTTLNAKQLAYLFLKIEELFELSSVLEWTVEAGRPDSITQEKLQVIKEHPITRISINPQTMKQDTLDLIGRKHTVEQTIACFEMARTMGFDNINMDLIVGLPNETLEDVVETLEKMKELQPDSLTVHSLAIKRAARINMFKGDYEQYLCVNTADMIDQTAACAKELQLLPYYMYRQKNIAGNFENVGYAQEGKAGIYNILMMEEKQTIIAVGAGATSKLVFDGGSRIERIGNVKDITHYLDRVEEMIERKRQMM